MNHRPSWDDYYINMLTAVSKRASCDRGKASAIIVKDKRQISSGYVGAPSGMPSCDEVGHDLWVVSKYPRVEWPEAVIAQTEKIQVLKSGKIIPLEVSTHCLRTIHAELNAILNAAYYGVSCAGATMYCTMIPCYPCAMAIAQSGITKVLAKYKYREQPKTMYIFEKLNIPITVISNETDPDKFE